MTDIKKEVDEWVEQNGKKEVLAKVFFNNKKAIHVVYDNLTFDNGYIVEFFGDGFMMQTFKGQTIPVFYLKVKDIGPYREKMK